MAATDSAAAPVQAENDSASNPVAGDVFAAPMGAVVPPPGLKLLQSADVGTARDWQIESGWSSAMPAVSNRRHSARAQL